MKRSEDRILTTHVGSLVRPPELLQSAAAREKPQAQQQYLDAVRRATEALTEGARIASSELWGRKAASFDATVQQLQGGVR